MGNTSSRRNISARGGGGRGGLERDLEDHTTLRTGDIRSRGRRDGGDLVEEKESVHPLNIAGARRDPSHAVWLSLDFHVEDNCKQHRTNLYDSMRRHGSIPPGSLPRPTPWSSPNEAAPPRRLVARRGLGFWVTLTFDREVDLERDLVLLVFETGNTPRENKGSSVRVLVNRSSSPGDGPNLWTADSVPTPDSPNDLRLVVRTPPSCPVAKWSVKVDVSSKHPNEVNDGVYSSYYTDASLYTVFNPWEPDDPAYYRSYDDTATDVDIEEYLLATHGLMYRGSAQVPEAKPWNYAQFSAGVLELALELIESVPLVLRGIPHHVARRLAAITNSQDDNGLVVGCWDGFYDGGRSPASWSGSLAILQEYDRTRTPVEYGQCWVFAGILTTLCRSLGLAARPVSNYSSAHDCDASASVDVYWSETGRKLDEYNCDTVWNFHVWTEVWMSRADLPAGCGGWQVLDATPQETSGGLYRSGPCSVHAVKQGLVELAHDGHFIFAEVNADIVHWLLKESGERTIIHRAEAEIGQCISTKAPGQEQRLDITDSYKYKEGTSSERSAVRRAMYYGSLAEDLLDGSDAVVLFRIIPPENIVPGRMLTVAVEAENRTEDDQFIDVTITGSLVHYTGQTHAQLGAFTELTTLKARQSITFSRALTTREVVKWCRDDVSIRVTCFARVGGVPKKFYVAMEHYPLCKPDITITLPSSPILVNQPFKVGLSFSNPIPVALKQATWSLEASNGANSMLVTHKGSIPAQGTAHMELELILSVEGPVTLAAGFDSNKLAGVTGTANVDVLP